MMSKEPLDSDSDGAQISNLHCILTLDHMSFLDDEVVYVVDNPQQFWSGMVISKRSFLKVPVRQTRQEQS